MKLQLKQKGFTLIELVVVIVILGILAATALPRFVNLSAEADAAAVKGLAGAINSACAINFAAGKAGKSGITAISGIAAARALLDESGSISGATITFTNETGEAPCTAAAP